MPKPSDSDRFSKVKNPTRLLCPHRGCAQALEPLNESQRICPTHGPIKIFYDCAPCEDRGYVGPDKLHTERMACPWLCTAGRAAAAANLDLAQALQRYSARLALVLQRMPNRDKP